tara:strand:+ start:24149 stop:25591 length:1443 start_codon:yes stop_codon:yes gene_type:complete
MKHLHMSAYSIQPQRATTSQLKLSPDSFSLANHYRSIAIFTDAEPDDMHSLLAHLHSIDDMRKQNNHFKLPKILIIAGGADARIQKARAQKYVELFKKEHYISKDFKIEFAQGLDFKGEYPKQGEDVFTTAEIDHIKKTTQSGMDQDKIIQFLKNDPQSLVMLLKRPDELMAMMSNLPNLTASSLLMYAGSFNIRLAAKEPEKFIKLTQLFRAFGYHQNFTSLQAGGAKDAYGTITPRDITPSTTPDLVKTLQSEANQTLKALRKNASIWNAKILHDFISKASQSNLSTSSEGISDKVRENHVSAAHVLQNEILNKYPTPQVFFDHLDECIPIIQKLSGQLSKHAVSTIDNNELGFRVKALENIAASPRDQVVIADQLIAMALAQPNLFENHKQGDLFISDKGFLGIKENKEGTGNAIDLGVIKGTIGDGKHVKPGESSKIGRVEHFLNNAMIPKSKPRRSFFDMSSINIKNFKLRSLKI